MPDSPVPVPSPAAGPRTLLGRLRSALRARHYSPRTEQAYVAWVRRYVQFHDRRHPATMGATEVQAFLTHLAERGRSEEHTSELQSRLHLVCRLLLEKKKNTTTSRLLLSTARATDVV